MEAIVFIYFIVLKDQLISISKYFHTSCTDQVQYIHNYHLIKLWLKLLVYWSFQLKKMVSTKSNGFHYKGMASTKKDGLRE